MTLLTTRIVGRGLSLSKLRTLGGQIRGASAIHSSIPPQASGDIRQHHKKLIVALHFPNPSRSYDAARHCVYFWGYDDSREITFEVDTATLKSLQPALRSDERSFLVAFDELREKLVEIAKKRYVRGPQNRYSI